MTMKRLFCASRNPASNAKFSWQSLLHNSHIRSLKPLCSQIRPGFRVFVRCLCSVGYLFCQGFLLSIAMLLPSNSKAFARQTHCFKRSMAWLFLTKSAFERGKSMKIGPKSAWTPRQNSRKHVLISLFFFWKKRSGSVKKRLVFLTKSEFWKLQDCWGWSFCESSIVWVVMFFKHMMCSFVF